MTKRSPPSHLADIPDSQLREVIEALLDYLDLEIGLVRPPGAKADYYQIRPRGDCK